LRPDVRLYMPATDERMVGRDAVIALQRDYPEPWGELRVLRTTGDGPVAAEIEIRAPDTTDRGDRVDPDRRPPG
jgi:hypothetical protein